MKLLITICLCWMAIGLHAQEVNTAYKKPRFFSANQAIHFEGKSGSAFGVQSVNGLEWKRWGAGIGLGLDRYTTRSVPLFVQLRSQVPGVRKPLYLYADGGRNFVWADDETNTWFSRNTYNGWYWDAGLQYRLTLKDRSALLFSAGISEKTYSEEMTTSGICNFGPCPEQKTTWDYRFRRVALKAGFQF